MDSDNSMKIKTTLSAPATWTRVGELLKVSGPVIKPGIYKGLGKYRLNLTAPVLDQANKGLLRQTAKLYHINKNGKPIGFSAAISDDHKAEIIIYDREGEQAVLNGDVKMFSIEAELDGKRVQHEDYDYDVAIVKYTGIALVKEGDCKGAYIESIGTIMMEKMEDSTMGDTETIEVEFKEPTEEDIKESETYKSLQTELEAIKVELEKTTKDLDVYREAELSELKDTIKEADPDFDAKVLLEGIDKHEQRKRILIKLAEVSQKKVEAEEEREEDKIPEVNLGVATEKDGATETSTALQKSLEKIMGTEGAKEYAPLFNK